MWNMYYIPEQSLPEKVVSLARVALLHLFEGSTEECCRNLRDRRRNRLEWIRTGDDDECDALALPENHRKCWINTIYLFLPLL